MDAGWISPALVGAELVVGLAISWRRDARGAGRRDQLLEQHEERLESHSRQIDEARNARAKHGERIAALESWRESGR